MGLVQCMICRLELPCQCSARVVTEAVESFKPRRSMATPASRADRPFVWTDAMPGGIKPLDQDAQERLWQAMMREQRGGSDDG